MNNEQVLDGSQGTCPRAECPAEKQGINKGQEEKGQRSYGYVISGITEGQSHILDGPYGTDTSFPVKSKINQCKDGKP